MTEQPPSYPPPPPGGYGAPQPPPGGYGYQPPPPGGYGYQPPPPGGYGYQPPPQAAGTNGMAIASLVFSLVGLLCWIGAIVGPILGFIALGQIKQTGQGGRGMAISGIVIGLASIVIGILLAIILLATKSSTSNTDSGTSSGAPAVVITVEQQPVSPALM